MAVVAGASVFIYYAKQAPTLDLSDLESTNSTKLLDSNGNVIATLGLEHRNLVQTNKIPVLLVNAVTSIEDHRFFNTRGVDPVRIAGSFVHNLKGQSLNGGSTLDMQLIKLGMFSTSKSDQNLKVKIQEAWLALELDQKWTKEQIFTAYVNKVNMGNGYYGMGTASEAYFGKPLTQLSIAQTALLAGMPQAPTTYNPYTNPTATKYRRDLVIGAMYKYGKITAAQEKKALATPIKSGLQPLKQSVSIPAYADSFLKQAVAQANKLAKKDISNAGVKVYTTLDNTQQQNLYNIINTSQYVPFTDSQLQVASTLVNVHTGAVVAEVGNRNQPTNVTFGLNRATQTDRDWGSTMKPLVDYGPAFENGIYTSTSDLVSDAPYTYPNGTAIKDVDSQYLGNITVKSALDLSRNIPALKTLESVGLDNSTHFLKNVGINLSPLQWSNAISSYSPNQDKSGYGVNSERMASAYAAFSNGGVYTEPYYVTKIIFPDGREIDYKPKRTQAMQATTAFAITDMLEGVPNLTSAEVGSNAKISGLPLAGKTGTSNYTDSEYNQIIAKIGKQSGMVSPDENFVGYTSQYAMSVWTGYANRLTPIYGSNVYIATDVFKSMFNLIYPAPTSCPTWTVPDGVTVNGENCTIDNTSSASTSSSSNLTN